MCACVIRLCVFVFVMLFVCLLVCGVCVFGFLCYCVVVRV